MPAAACLQPLGARVVEEGMGGGRRAGTHRGLPVLQEVDAHEDVGIARERPLVGLIDLHAAAMCGCERGRVRGVVDLSGAGRFRVTR